MHIYIYIWDIGAGGGRQFHRKEDTVKSAVILVRVEIDYVPTPRGSEKSIGLRKRVSVIGMMPESSSRRVIFLELTGPSPWPHGLISYRNVLYIIRA